MVLYLFVFHSRCLDDEETHAATLSLRRQQFIERCHESRAVRNWDSIPEVRSGPVMGLSWFYTAETPSQDIIISA